MSVSNDKELLILTQLDANPEATQRDISSQTGLSLGSVNLLLKKMIKEGLVKIESVPAHRVAYMLTPKGMMEKVNKTVNYIKRHYNAIDHTKETMKSVLQDLTENHSQLYLLNTGDEVSRLMVTALEEMGSSTAMAITTISKAEEAKEPNIPIIHCLPDQDLENMSYSNPIINLLEKL